MAPDPSLSAYVCPTGGIVVLNLSSAAATGWTLTRAVSGVSGVGAPTTIYSGPSLASPTAPNASMPVVDCGDGTPLPLDQSTAYVWTFTTPNGSATVGPLVPAVAISVQPDILLEVMSKALMAGVSALVIPEGLGNTPTVMQAMPVNSTPALPMICVNEDLIQMSATGIGAGVDTDQQFNRYEVGSLARRRINVSVHTLTVEERAFYKSAIIGIWRSLLGPLLGRIGQNVTQSYQAADTQDAGADTQPGFYTSEIMLEFEGVFNVTVTTKYGVVGTIVPLPNGTFG